jgi:hypothetical protein
MIKAYNLRVLSLKENNIGPEGCLFVTKGDWDKI